MADAPEQKHERVANRIAEDTRLLSYVRIELLYRVASEILREEYGGEDTTAGGLVAVKVAIGNAAYKLDQALLSPYDYESRAKLFAEMIHEELDPVLETIRTGAGTETIALLNQIRSEGWLIATHQDHHHDGDELTYWLFAHRDYGFVQGVAETDLEALVRVRSAIDKLEADRTVGPTELVELRMALRRIRMKNDESKGIIQQQTYKIADEALGREEP